MDDVFGRHLILSALNNEKTSRQKTCKDVVDLNTTIKQLDLPNIHRTAEYALFQVHF